MGQCPLFLLSKEYLPNANLPSSLFNPRTWHVFHCTFSGSVSESDSTSLRNPTVYMSRTIVTTAFLFFGAGPLLRGFTRTFGARTGERYVK